MTFLMRNWKYALILSGTLATIIFFGLWRLEVAETQNLTAQIDTLQDTILDYEADVKQCESDKKLTESISNDHQRKISALNRQLNDFKQLRDPRNARCIKITR